VPIFFHSNPERPNNVFGPCYGLHDQFWPISLGCTAETTIAFTRVYFANIPDLMPTLQVIGRIKACVTNNNTWQPRLAVDISRMSPRDVPKRNVYLDGNTFGCGALRAVAEVVGIVEP
jgi:hypothetical protein